jgi:transposase-like protein
MILSEISKLTETEARELLESIRWPEGPVCPHCLATNSYKVLENKGKKVRSGLYGCKACEKQFTVTVKTVMDRSHIPIRTWLLAFSIMCASKKGVSALQLQRQLGLGSYRSAWHMCHRVRYAMKQDPLKSLLLEGAVEVDETYVGGKPRGMKGTSHIGRGTKKAAVVALVERGGRVRAKHVADVTGKTLKGAIRDNVDPSATIYTDEYKLYHGIGSEFAGGHHTVKHSAGEYVRGHAHTQNVEAFFGLLKRSVTGSWHHVSKQHLDRYIDEVGFRWNHRHVNDATRTFTALKQSEGKRLLYKQTVSE